MPGQFKWKSRFKCSFALGCCAAAALFCGGCAGTELENKSFPLAVLIAQQEQQCQVCYLSQDLSAVANEQSDGSNITAASALGSTYYETQKAFEKNNRCQLDLSHTKALVFSEDYLKNGFSMFLETVRRENIYARNTLVYLTESSMKDMADLNSDLDVPLGSYLEQMMENEQDIKEQAVVTLGMLLNEQANRKRTILVPVLRAEQGLPVIRSYVALQDFESKGRISTEEAQVYYLLQNQLDEMDLHLDADTQIRLSGLSCGRSFESEGDRIIQELDISADAEQITGRASEKEIEDMLQEKIQDICRGSQKQQIDVSDSYRWLARYAPELYLLYEKDPASYREQLEYITKVHVNVVQNSGTY